MTMKFRALLIAISLVVLATISLVGCGHYVCGTTFGNATCTSSGSGISQGGGGGSIGLTAFVYFVDDKSGQMALEGLNVSNSQAFLPVGGFVSPTLPAGPTTDFGVAIVGKQYLYVPFVNNTLYGFSIDGTTGALAPVSSSSPYTVIAPTCVAADPNGAVLFVGGAAGISAFTVSSTDGSLALAGTYATGGITPTQLVTDGLGKYVYALTGTTITAFAYNSAGTLAAVTGSPFTFPQAMAQISRESTGKYILGITAEVGAGNGSVDKSIYEFGIAQSGNLGALTQLSTTSTVYSPVYMAVSPNGAYVYTFNELYVGVTLTPEAMEGYALNNATGALTPLSNSPFLTMDMSIGKFDQSGEYLFTQGSVSGTGGSWALPASPTTGALSSTIPQISTVSTSFGVTDAP